MMTAMIAPTKALRDNEWPISDATKVSAAKRPSAGHGMSAQLIGMAMLLSVASARPAPCLRYQIRRKGGDILKPHCGDEGERRPLSRNSVRIQALSPSRPVSASVAGLHHCAQLFT